MEFFQQRRITWSILGVTEQEFSLLKGLFQNPSSLVVVSRPDVRAKLESSGLGKAQDAQDLALLEEFGRKLFEADKRHDDFNAPEWQPVDPTDPRSEEWPILF